LDKSALFTWAKLLPSIKKYEKVKEISCNGKNGWEILKHFAEKKLNG